MTASMEWFKLTLGFWRKVNIIPKAREMSHLKSIKNGQKWLFFKENLHYTENGLLLWLGTSLVYF